MIALTCTRVKRISNRSPLSPLLKMGDRQSTFQFSSFSCNFAFNWSIILFSCSRETSGIFTASRFSFCGISCSFVMVMKYVFEFLSQLLLRYRDLPIRDCVAVRYYKEMDKITGPFKSEMFSGIEISPRINASRSFANLQLLH